MHKSMQMCSRGSAVVQTKCQNGEEMLFNAKSTGAENNNKWACSSVVQKNVSLRRAQTEKLHQEGDQ